MRGIENLGTHPWRRAERDNLQTLLDGLVGPPAVLRATGRLAANSMLTTDEGTLAMHRLVQVVTRTPVPGDPHRDPEATKAARRQAHPQLAGALPDSEYPAGWAGRGMLLPRQGGLAWPPTSSTCPGTRAKSYAPCCSAGTSSSTRNRVARRRSRPGDAPSRSPSRPPRRGPRVPPADCEPLLWYGTGYPARLGLVTRSLMA